MRPRVVVVGAGFGGLNAARALAGKDVDVLVLDKNNYHGFWPLLYQVATAGLEPESIAYPVRAIFHKSRNVRFRMAEVQSIDLAARKITTTGALLTYDYLVLAAGSANNYFGNNALAAQTFGLKDLEDAERLRNKMLLAFEQAITEKDPERRKALMTFAVIGGGPTGVELSGALSELVHHVLFKDYPMLHIEDVRIILIEASDRILAAFPESLQKSAMQKLAGMRVDVRFKAPVDTVEDAAIKLKDGSTIQASTVIWAAGVRSSKLADGLGVELARNARVKIAPELNLPGRPEVFVIGDMAYLEGYKEGEAYPMVAQPAIQQGKHAAHNILKLIQGEPLEPFKYFDPGTMATIGRRFAVLDAFGLKLSGRLAWFGWLFIHIMYLVGFRNRLIVLTNWIFNYFSYERGVRLITGRYLPEEEVSPAVEAQA
ncbi:MAG TPA: NAD(P)/FAD-dependent oxidoreductase [Chloroflexia bacterium]|nr:NAD(P)/FAD-dependent oxidoreductase [Chloroflexia bacterium]